MLTNKQIKDPADPVLEYIENTYNASFPETERRSFSLVKALIRPETVFSVYAFFQEGTYVGFITAWSFSGFTYIEHFAIDEQARNGGIGGRVLKQFIAGCSTPIVLEVEMPADEMSKRRVGFYERLGFTLDSHLYYQPPYREGDTWLEMRLMSYGAIDLATAFEDVKENIYHEVYGQTKGEKE